MKTVSTLTIQYDHETGEVTANASFGEGITIGDHENTPLDAKLCIQALFYVNQCMVYVNQCMGDAADSEMTIALRPLN